MNTYEDDGKETIDSFALLVRHAKLHRRIANMAQNGDLKLEADAGEAKERVIA
jgi:hypothetical protein